MRLSFFSLLVLSLCVISFSQESKKFAQITDPVTNIYRELDPKSGIIKQAKVNETYPLSYAGTSWYRITIDGQEGFIEARSAKIVDTANPMFSISFTTLVIFIVVLVGTFAAIGVIVFRNRNDAF